MRKWLALSVQIPFVAMMWAGCNGGDDTSDAGDASQDVKIDKKVPLDVSVPESPAGCVPADVNASDLSWTPPAALDPNACSDVQIQEYYTNCLPGSGSSCSTWESVTANANCAKCLLTSEAANAWSALIAVPNNVVYANVGGCIALLTGDSSASGCGAKSWQASQCENLAVR